MKEAAGGRSDGPKSARSVSRFSRASGGQPADPYAEHTVEMMDELIAEVTKKINVCTRQLRKLEGDRLATQTTINAKAKPIKDEMNLLRAQLAQYEAVKDAKIPDHEKLPKDCIFYLHFLQVANNNKIKDAAKKQINEDKELL